MRKGARRMHGCYSHAILGNKNNGDRHVEIIFEGQVMISCKNKTSKWQQGEVELGREIMMRVNSGFQKFRKNTKDRNSFD
jgi:hypothetical protein